MDDEGREERGTGDPGAPRSGEPRPFAERAELFDAMPVAAAVLDADGVVRRANPVFVDLLGTSRLQLVGRSLRELVEPDQADTVLERMEQVLAGARNAFECPLVAAPAALGGPSWPVQGHVAPSFGADGRVEGLVVLVFDFAPADSPPSLPAGLAAVLEEGSDFLVTVGPDEELVYGNRAAREQLGVGLAGGAALLSDVLEPASVELFREIARPALQATGTWQGELSLRTRQGRALAVSARIVAHQAQELPGAPAGPRTVSIFARDITELKTAERKLRQLATHDYLTGLPNRLLLYDRLELALNRFARYGTPVALMFCDLDGFKPVNDAYGHQVGDAVLTEVADRIHSVVRDTDTAARLGGDEFAVLVEGVDDLGLLTSVAERLVDAIAEPVHAGGATASVGISIGLVVASERCQEADALVAAADAAMYAAKAEGRGRYHIWTGDEDDSTAGGRGS
jgi:diguanylate cyclase (GGDEF)-like protein/PAS domain S-box-containing protein